MTIRSKQWYTKTRKRSNSFVKVSIGLSVRCFGSIPESSVRRPMESTVTLLPVPKFSPQDFKGGALGYVLAEPDPVLVKLGSADCARAMVFVIYCRAETGQQNTVPAKKNDVPRLQRPRQVT